MSFHLAHIFRKSVSRVYIYIYKVHGIENEPFIHVGCTPMLCTACLQAPEAVACLLPFLSNNILGITQGFQAASAGGNQEIDALSCSTGKIAFAIDLPHCHLCVVCVALSSSS